MTNNSLPADPVERALHFAELHALIAAWRVLAAEPTTLRSPMALAVHGARTGAYQACAAALADLLDGGES